MFIKLYLITLPIYLAIDMIWLGLITKNFYRDQIGFLMKSKINWIATTIFYLIFTAGLVLFVITPALGEVSLLYALIFGGLFGLITYATYDLTNLATIKDWPLTITIVDIIWGTLLSAFVCVISLFIAIKIGI